MAYYEFNYINYIPKTVPLETNILNAHTRKAEKNSHFIPDITSANVTALRKPHTERS